MKIVLQNYLPLPAARPRLAYSKRNRWTEPLETLGASPKPRIYSPSSAPELAMAWQMLAALDDRSGFPLACSASISVHITHFGQLRGDGDNFLKFVADATQKAGFVQNDSQYKKWNIEIEEGESDKTTLAIEPYISRTQRKEKIAKKIQHEAQEKNWEELTTEEKTKWLDLAETILDI